MLEQIKRLALRKIQQNNVPPATSQNTAALKRVRRKIGWQAGFAVLTVLLTVVIVVGMTAAWYTNVVQTGSLIFQVEQWGVNVNATISTTAIEAEPGAQGVVSFRVDNPSTNLVKVTVSVTKAAMSEELRKRVFFYVDTQYSANGETVQRSYLTSQDGYDYMLFQSDSLILSETQYNNAQLKWCWVYDLLGYYVTAQPDENGQIVVTEYLRPIEYSFDDATFHADGTLATVDGTTTAQAFLTALSRADGYAGDLSAVTAIDGYYPVAVDEDGYGVYAYLLNLQQIEEAIDYDTAMGNAAAAGTPETFSAKFTVYAENLTGTVASVNSAAALSQALTAGTAQIVQLAGNVVLPENETITLPAGTEVYLDLNGHSLTTDSTSAAITVEADSKLTMYNGTLTGAQGSGDAFYVTGGDVTLHNLDLSGYGKAFNIRDDQSGGEDSTIRIIDCRTSTTGCSILVHGNGKTSEQTTKIIIDGSTMLSDSYVLGGNGTSTGAGRWGTDIQILNSELVSDPEKGYAAIYHPQKYGMLNIVGSKITGFVGVAVKGGTVIITDSVITGAGAEDKIMPPSLNVSGYADTGDAVYVETGYDYDIFVQINGNSVLQSHYAMSLRVYEENAACVTVVKNGGTYLDQTEKTGG